MNWAKKLEELGLESPGREEAVKATLEFIAHKKQISKDRVKNKGKGGRKKR